MVTKQRVLVVIGVSWLISCVPMLISLLQDLLNTDVPDCYSKQGYCHRQYYIYIDPTFSWAYSAVWTIFLTLVFVIMILVYGYIIWIINGVSTRNPGFRKKKSAVITTLFLILSFLLSYIFYFIQHFYIAAERSHETKLTTEVNTLFSNICPACHLMLDFLFTGMIGSIMDPLIYCARMKEIKLALNKLFGGTAFVRRPSITSTGGYIKAAPHSEEEHL